MARFNWKSNYIDPTTNEIKDLTKCQSMMEAMIQSQPWPSFSHGSYRSKSEIMLEQGLSPSPPPRLTPVLVLFANRVVQAHAPNAQDTHFHERAHLPVSTCIHLARPPFHTCTKSQILHNLSLFLAHCLVAG